MEAILREHLKRYPLSQPQDAVKLIYQNEFGPGHLLRSREEALMRLIREMETDPPETDLPLENVGNGLYRLYLGGLQSLGIEPETAVGLFARACRPMGNSESLESKTACLEKLAREHQTPFSEAALTEWLKAWREAGCPAVHHSEIYREAYHPAYRVIEETAVRLMPLFTEIDRVIRKNGGCVIKLDGRCASGKSTLAEYLYEVYADTKGRASLFHMDDYFLPETRKTKERLSEPGGNVDWERFFEEVDGIPVKQEVTWRPFSCGEQRLAEARKTPGTALRIIEGAYSMRPGLSRPDIAVFMDVSAELQLQRILARNGEIKLRRFKSEWIPLEEAYIAACLKPSDFNFHLKGEDWRPVSGTESFTRRAESRPVNAKETEA